jgi:hypothetical protein
MTALTMTIHKLRAELKRTTIHLNASISSVRTQVNDTTASVGTFGGFDTYLKPVNEFLQSAIFLIDTLKFDFRDCVIDFEEIDPAHNRTYCFHCRHSICC